MISMPLSVYANYMIIIVMDEFKNNSLLSKGVRCFSSYDFSSFMHSIEVAYYSALIGTELELGREQMAELVQAGILHDFGVCGSDPRLLNGADKLNETEVDRLKLHIIIGERMLKSASLSKDVRQCLDEHRSRVEAKRNGQEIIKDHTSLYGRIIAVADTYSELTYDAEDGTALPYDKAATEIAKDHTLDREIVDNLFVALSEVRHENCIAS